MCIAQETTDQKILTEQFTQMQSLLHQLQTPYPCMDTLSMGMSSDLELAIAHGATHVRVGSAIFGIRKPKNS